MQTVARIVDMSELTPNQKRCCVELVKGRTGIQTAGSRCFQVIRRPEFQTAVIDARCVPSRGEEAQERPHEYGPWIAEEKQG